MWTNQRGKVYGDEAYDKEANACEGESHQSRTDKTYACPHKGSRQLAQIGSYRALPILWGARELSGNKRLSIPGVLALAAAVNAAEPKRLHHLGENESYY